MVVKVTVYVRRKKTPLPDLTRPDLKQLLIGIPSGTPRNDNAPNNAMLLFWHEFGTVTEPPRPSLVPGVRMTKAYAVSAWKKALQRYLKSKNPADLDLALNMIGLVAVSNVRRIIQSKIPPPISETTKRWRLMKRNAYKNASPARQASMMKTWLAGSFTPLIDTGQMIQAITYVIRKSR